MNGKRPGGWVALAIRWYRDPKFDGLSAGGDCALDQRFGVLRRAGDGR